MTREAFGIWLGRYWHIIATIVTVWASAFMFLFNKINRVEQEMTTHRLLSEYTILGLCSKPEQLDLITRSLLRCSQRMDLRNMPTQPAPLPIPPPP